MIVIRLGLTSGHDHLHLCDFDHLLHWAAHYPDELRQVIGEITDYDLLILGHTACTAIVVSEPSPPIRPTRWGRSAWPTWSFPKSTARKETSPLARVGSRDGRQNYY